MTDSSPTHDTLALVVAAGSGARAGGGLPKQYRMLGDATVLHHAAAAMLAHPRVGAVHVVVAPGEERRARYALGTIAATISAGANTRQESVFRGLQYLADNYSHHPFVLVHDAARPLVPMEMVGRVLDALADHKGACPALPVADSLRRGTTTISGEVSREQLWRAQTPQGFHFADLLAAHRQAALAHAGDTATDDAEIMRAAGHTVALTQGDERAMKITVAADFEAVARWLQPAPRTDACVSGQGFDVHRFGTGDHLWLCGVRIPHTHGLIGHSDADVGLHALTDALLGAVGKGDIGQHFPPSDPQWRGAGSERFLAHAASLVSEAGGRVLHCDVTLICEAPKIGPYRDAMRSRISEILQDHAPVVNIKATTTEGLGFCGRREGIAAQAMTTIRIAL